MAQGPAKPPDHNVPAPVTTLVGRTAELDGIGRTMRRSRMVTLAGPGGVGKTRMAVELGRRQIDRRPDGVWIVDLTTAASPADVAPETARTLAVRAASDRAATEALRGYLATRDLLLVLDNCEHVVGACAELADAMLARCERVQILATSREPLDIAGESVWRLEPLSAEAAHRLFVERARQRRPDFLPDEETDAILGELLERLDRLPLAIELAAGRIGAMSPGEILAGLEELRGGRLAAPRHRTLRTAVDWSYRLLDADEQRALRQMSVFVGGFGAAAATAVADVPMELLARLVDKSLVSATETARGQTRYRLLETVREHASELLVEAGELESARDAHLRYFTEVCGTPGEGWPSSAAPKLVAALGDDYENVRAALQWAVERDPAAGVRLLWVARDLFFMFGQGEGMRLGLELLERTAGRDRRTVEAQITTGVLGMWVDTPTAEALFDEAAPLARSLGLPDLEGWSRLYLGLLGTLGERFESARPHVEASTALFRRAGSSLGLARSTAVLGLNLAATGDVDRGRELVEEALAFNADAGDGWGQGHCNLYLGIIAGLAGDSERAGAHYRTAIDAFLPARDATLLPVALVGQAGVIARADPARALQVAAAAASARARVGSHYAPFYAALAAKVRADAEARAGEGADRLWAAGSRLGLDDAVALAFGAPPERGPTAPAGVSERELEIAGLVAEGRSNKEIAAQLHLSVRTVESHVRHALAKLGLDNRTQLATWVRERTR